MIYKPDTKKNEDIEIAADLFSDKVNNWFVKKYNVIEKVLKDPVFQTNDTANLKLVLANLSVVRCINVCYRIQNNSV
ncbi:MAG: hypothetical protein GY797_32175 [Deltaproteobacteria bacterium]|nr:hypothetical protein [Deltaproteobacteria bacterium]